MSINKEIGPSVFIVTEDQIKERVKMLDNDTWKGIQNMVKAQDIRFWSQRDRLSEVFDIARQIKDN